MIGFASTRLKICLLFFYQGGAPTELLWVRSMQSTLSATEKLPYHLQNILYVLSVVGEAGDFMLAAEFSAFGHPAVEGAFR